MYSCSISEWCMTVCADCRTSRSCWINAKKNSPSGWLCANCRHVSISQSISNIMVCCVGWLANVNLVGLVAISLSVSVSVIMTILQVSPGYLVLLKLTMMEVMMTTAAINCGKLQSDCHHQQTNTQCFTGRMPFLSPGQGVRALKGKVAVTVCVWCKGNTATGTWLWVDLSQRELALGVMGR